MTSEPPLYFRVLASRVVVHDQVNLPVGGNHVIDRTQELEPLLMAVTIIARGDHLAFQGIQGGKQSWGAVALVIVGHGAVAPLLHRQTWLGVVQSLNLALLAGTQSDSLLVWVKVKADALFQLFPTFKTSD